MTRRSQKCWELDVFGVFVQLFHEFSLGSAEEDERPDLLVHAKGQTIGIEITKLFTNGQGTSKRPYGVRDLNGIQERIVADAKRQCAAEGIPPLWVRVWFSPDMKHEKLASKRSAAVSRMLSDRVKEWCDQSLPYGDLPLGEGTPEILRVDVFRASGAAKWEKISVCLVGSVPMQKVQERIDEKNELCESYREKCDQCWLLMVTDHYNPGQVFKPEFYVSLGEHSFSYAFDRVFMIEVCPHYEQLVELKRVHADLR